MRFFIGISGASGHLYADGVIRALVAAGHDVDVSVTAAGCKVLRHELGVEAGEHGEALRQDLERWLGPAAARVRAFDSRAIESPPSSGTALTGAAILVPCSMGTMARVAAGFSSNLVERAADVALKEGRTLVLVPREAPYSQIHLENMLRLARLGAVVLPASPGFYHRPRTIDELVAQLVGKILDRVGVTAHAGARWQGLPDDAQDSGTGRPVPTDPMNARQAPARGE